MQKPDGKKNPDLAEKKPKIKLTTGQAGDLSEDEVKKRLARLEKEVARDQNSRISSPVSGDGNLTTESAGVSQQKQPKTMTSGGRMALFWTIVVLTVVSANLPFAQVIFAPLNQFTVLIHELSHALACIATGGQVAGMTIVADGAGHGGLTFARGGLQFIFAPAGYVGTAIVGCLLVYLGQFRKLSKALLVIIGLIMTGATFAFMGPGLLSASFLQVLMSMLWGLALSAGAIWAGVKLKEQTANIVLLILAIRTALDSISSLVTLVFLSASGSAIWSDATIMQNNYGLPAIFWAVSWAIFSMVLLGITIWFTYGLGAVKRIEFKK